VRFNNQDIVVSHILALQDGTFLLSTQKNGLLLLKNGNVSTYLDITNGLNSNMCLKSFELKDKIFTLTELGFNVINKSNKSVNDLSTTLSLTNINILDFAVIDNTILLATDHGLLYFLLQEETRPVLPILNKLLFFKAQDTRPISNEALSYKENNVVFLADAVHFLNDGDFNFEYRLLGLDSTWYAQPASKNKFNYFALPPGKYTFELKMTVNDFESPIYARSFRIKKAFWQTTWFYLLLFGLLSLVLYYLFRRVLLQQRRKAQNEQRLLQSQLTSLRAQMNPHFLFNIVNSVQGLIYANKKKEASEMLGKMSALIRNVLEMSEQENVTLQREIELLQSYILLESARFEEDFHYDIEVNVPKEYLDLEIPSMIVQPFIENAIKHGLLHKEGLKKLHVSINKSTTNQVIIRIEDNGIGRKASTEINSKRINHQSFASEAIASRIDLINSASNKKKVVLEIQDIENMNTSSTGTIVTLIIETNE
jgi:two-component sensor histidine kinase